MAGTSGGYTPASLATLALSLLGPDRMDPVEAVTAATPASFALSAIIALSAFYARSAARAWLAALAVAIGLAVLLTCPEPTEA